MERACTIEESGAFDTPDQNFKYAEDVVPSIVSAVIAQLQDGRVSISGTADQLGISVRSLQRRLTSHGLSYRELVESVRRN